MSTPSSVVAAVEPSYFLQRGLACGAVALLLGLTQGLGLNLVSSNLTSIQGSLGATATEANWLTTAYFATALSASLLLVKVRLHFGLEAFATCGIVGFLLVGATHLLTNSIVSAVAVRAALGLAAAPISSLAVLYMIQAFPKRLAPIGLVLGFGCLQFGAPLSRVVSRDLLEVGQWHGLFLLDVALAVLSFAAIHAVSLPPVPRRNAFCPGDLVSFPLYAVALGLFCVVLSQGRLYWWTDAPWLGVCLASGIACFGLYVIVELGRANPMLDLKWVVSPFMLRFVVAILLFRIVLSEQTLGVVGLMTALGQSNDQMQRLFGLVCLGMLVGFVAAAAIAARGGENLLGLISTALVLLAATLDAKSTSLTRPDQFLFTQPMLGAAVAMYFSGACLIGFGPVAKDGNRNIVTFLAAFSAAQYMGTLLGTAWIGTFIVDHQKLHFAALTQRLQLSDPTVAGRVSQLSLSVGRFVTDPAARVGQGIALLNQQVSRESLVLAYDDLFQTIAALAAVMFVWLAVLAWRSEKRKRAELSPAQLLTSAAVAAR